MPRSPGPHDLFIELSHPGRLAILEHLGEGGLRLSELTRRVRIAPPETSRHLDRLRRGGLVERTSEGRFVLTGVGRLVADRLPWFQFVLRHQEFLRTHDLTVLPSSLIARLGELSDPETGSTFVDTLRAVQRVFLEAREFAWFITDQPMLTVREITERSDASRVPVRAIVTQGILNEPVRPTTRADPSALFQVRAVASIGAGLAMNEREAGISFADLRGRIDYSSGLRGASPSFRGWCRDLFEEYWSQGRPVRIASS